MKRGMVIELAAVVAFLLLTTATIALSGADLALSSHFCIGGNPKTPKPHYRFRIKVSLDLNKITLICSSRALQ